jgi:hypothetical protein
VKVPLAELSGAMNRGARTAGFIRQRGWHIGSAG